MAPKRSSLDGLVEFTAAFDGPAVETGRMSAKEFASSVFALAELVEQAAAVKFHQENAVALEVRADFRHGSFEFGLVASSVIPVAVPVLQAMGQITPHDLLSLLKSIGIVGGMTKNLLSLVKRYGPKPVVEVRQDGDNNVSVVFIAGSDAQIVTGVSPDVAKLLQSERVREALPEVFKPLVKDGIDSFRIGPKSKPDFSADKHEVGQFEVPPASESELTDSIAETALELLAPNFVEGNIWRVAQGGQAFNVRLLDTEFLERIDHGEPFAKGDYLIVALRTRTFATAKGLRVEREILRVLKHQRRADQRDLFSQ